MGFESSSICSSSFIQLPSTEVCAQFFSVETSIKTIHCWNTKATEGQVLRNRCYCWLEWFYELHEKFPISVTNEEFGGILDEQQYSMPTALLWDIKKDWLPCDLNLWKGYDASASPQPLIPVSKNF